MRHLMAAALIAIVSPLAAPAVAQFMPGPPAPRAPRVPGPLVGHASIPSPDVWRDIGDVRDRIDRGRDAGTLSRQEARQLRREARMIGVLAERYGRDGLSDAERTELEARMLYLRDAVNVARTP